VKSYTGLRNLYATLTNNNDSANLVLGDELINDSLRRVYSERDWDFLQKSGTASTVAGTQFYTLPYDYDELIDVTITIGTTKYVPIECPNQTFWDYLNRSTTFQSDFPEYYYIFNGQIGFYPTPSGSNSNAITYNYRRKVVDLSIADFTTGTVSATNGSTTITNSGSNWTAPMAGRFIKLTPTNTAASTGDGVWYEVASVSSATVLLLVKPYNGTTTAGAAYTLSQVPILPESYQDMPVYDAASTYFSSINPNRMQAELYAKKAEYLLNKLRADHGTKTTDPSIHDAFPRKILNPNLFITL